MDITWLSEDEVYMMQAETPEEQDFLDACPQDWTWHRVLRAWDDYRRKDEHCAAE